LNEQTDHVYCQRGKIENGQPAPGADRTPCGTGWSGTTHRGKLAATGAVDVQGMQFLDSVLANFASHLIRDQNAVLAALNTPWSNGPVEGQVHRLKLIKRQMYGRASFALLKLRVLT
jgi:hypothetical protein